MVNASVKTKEALREGDTKKEYRFKASKPVETTVYNDLGTITAASPTYTLATQCDNTKVCVIHTFVPINETISGWLIWPDQSRIPLRIYPDTGHESVRELTYGILPVGTILSFTAEALGSYEIGVTLSDRITTQTEWVEQFTIDNDSLVYESVKIDERMCSGDLLKFGLCEGSSLEFQYFDHPNINGYRLEAFIDVSTKQTNPTGWGTVKTMTFYDHTYQITTAGSYRLIVSANNRLVVSYEKDGAYNDTIIRERSDEETVIYFNDCTPGDRFEIINIDVNYTILVQRYEDLNWSTIPMGFFYVKKCSRQASTGIQKVTAYNKLQSDYLDTDASIMIQNTQSDGSDMDDITLKSLTSELLGNYQIHEAGTRMEVSPTFDGVSGVFSAPSFKMTGSSTTLYPVLYTSKLVYYTPNYNVHRFEYVIDKYVEKLNKAVDALKVTVFNTVQNPETFWSNFLNSRAYQVNFGVNAYFQPVSVGWQPDGVYLVKGEPPATYQSQFTTQGTVEGLKFLHGVYRIDFEIPYKLTGSTSSSSVVNEVTVWELDNDDRMADGDVEIYDVEATDLDMIEISRANAPQVTLRQLMSAYYELKCQYGQLDRVTDLFSGVELGRSALYPADTLYPAVDRYPDGVGETSYRSWYSKLWTDTHGEQSFRYLIITYKGLDANNVPTDLTLTRLINADGTTDYNMSDNWLFKNMIWTAEDVSTYADAMVEKMQPLRWFPFEMWAAGLPYLETGDMIEIIVDNETHISYVLQRQLQGIQNLQDTYINGTLDIF